MSQYFSFRIVEKRDGKYYAAAPFVRQTNGEFKWADLLCRSRSFIDQDAFREIGDSLGKDEMGDDLVRKYSITTNWGDEEYSKAFIISRGAMYNLATEHNGGHYIGFVDENDARRIIENKYVLEDRFDVDLIPAELAVGKPDLVKMAFTVYNDPSYQANYLLDCMNELTDYDDREFYFIFETEY